MTDSPADVEEVVRVVLTAVAEHQMETDIVAEEVAVVVIIVIALQVVREEQEVFVVVDVILDVVGIVEVVDVIKHQTFNYLSQNGETLN